MDPRSNLPYEDPNDMQEEEYGRHERRQDCKYDDNYHYSQGGRSSPRRYSHRERPHSRDSFDDRHRRHGDRHSEYRSRYDRHERTRDSSPYGYSRREDRDWGRDRQRDRGRGSYSYRDEEPTRIILFRNLTLNVTEDMIRVKVNSFGLDPIDIRLVKRDNGESRRIAFVEFRDEAEGSQFMQATEGAVKLDGVHSTLHFSIPRSEKSGAPTPSSDWSCSRCFFINFGRRSSCLKCGTPQGYVEEYSSSGDSQISRDPTNTLLIQNLDVIVTEEMVLSFLGKQTSLPIKHIKIMKDPLINVSLGFCLVEMNSVREAATLHDLLLSLGDEFKINDQLVSVSYWKKPEAESHATNQNIAAAALSAAQWTNQVSQENTYPNGQDNPYGYMPANLGSVTINGVTYMKYPVPDVKTFQYDQTSGFYYDAYTGFYYDAKSQHFYNSATQQYMYWDGEHQTYIPVVSSASDQSTKNESSSKNEESLSANENTLPSTSSTSTASTSSSKPNEEKVSKKEKKLLEMRKIAKDMERWAKMQDKKKEIARQNSAMMQAQNEVKASADVGYAILEKEVVKTIPNIGAKNTDPEIKSTALSILACYGEDDNTDAIIEQEQDKILDEWKAEVAKLLDWEKLTCLLCKRKFTNKEIMSKHEQQSNLHKQNLEALKYTKLSPGQIEALEQRAYRDRAKERREKYGQPEIPPIPETTLRPSKRAPEETISYEEPTKFGIGSDNVGNKMLKLMGWSEGQGLGKDNKGTTQIIDVVQKKPASGLGLPAAPTPPPGEKFDYRKYGKQLMHARYHELP